MAESSVKLTVVVYPDGGTDVSLPAVPDDRRRAVLDAAAVALARAATSAAADEQPVRCGVCGERALSVEAPPAGRGRLLPCGHRLT